MRPRLTCNLPKQSDVPEEKSHLKAARPPQNNPEFGFSNMLSRRHRHRCILILATAWTLLGTYFITVNVFIQQTEGQAAEGQGRSLHTSRISTESAPRMVEAHGGGSLGGNKNVRNSADKEEEVEDGEKELLSDQDTPVEEMDQSDENPEDKEMNDSEDESHYEYKDFDVDDFCDDFEKHYGYKISRLNLPVSDKDGNSFESLVKILGSRMKKGRRLLSPTSGKMGKASWLSFYHEITQYGLYDPSAPTVSQLLNDMATNPVLSIANFNKGTQIKLLLTFKDGAVALFKPMRFPRKMETLADHFYFNDYERHIAEIAAFHLDRYPSHQRVLGFHRVPPTVGRVFSIQHDFNRFENTTFEENVYRSPAGNTCFYTECDMYCDSNHPICGNPDKLEASLQILLPGKGKAKHEDQMNPWGRSYSKTMLSPWQHDDEYCDKVRKDKLYREGRRLLDVMDVSVFDFLMGNMDRHDIDVFLRFGSDTSPILFDSGRGFGKSREDVDSILTPIEQCCKIRFPTLAKLVKLYRGPEKLSGLMRTSLDKDPLENVLTHNHLDALDRRVVAILNVVRECVERTGGFDKVVQDDWH